MDSTPDSDQKPSYLGLLNAIVLAERRGHAVLDAWRWATPLPALADTLNVVAIREQAHAAEFTKRLCELGYGVRERPSATFEADLALARSGAPDADKFRCILGYGDPEEASRPDPLAALFADRTIDPVTGALLGRFIAEERDSERRLRAAWRGLPASGDPAGGTDDDLLAEVAERIDRLTATLEELKRLRR
ncbi:MAG: hypothetical protein CMD39_05580 [Gammaproteobacteria bacterium]|nr:hypothetical protein [Gammaproteobacteria bacterium]